MFIVPVTRDHRHLSRLLDDTFERFFTAPAGTEGSDARSPALDVADSGSAYTVTLEMPGVAKEDVKISVDGRQVSVQAQHTEEKKEGERVVYRERASTRYARSFTLPAEVAQGDAAAKLENGVLTLTLPKRGANGATQIAIN
jgi:HSP20 family protein